MVQLRSWSLKASFLIALFIWQSISALASPLGGPGDPAKPDSLHQPRGHCKAQIRLDTICATQEITISAYIYWTFTGVLQPTVATWSTGQFAHKITVTPPGTWYWDPIGTTCEEYHWETDLTLDLPFFEGPVELSAPTAICPDESYVEINANLNNYSHFETLTWSPPHPGSDFDPYPVSQAGTYGVTVTDPYGCSSSDQVTIVEVPVFNPGITGPVRMCPEGDTAQLAITNPGQYTSFQWDNGEVTTPITVLEPGIYQVTATNSHGCTGSNSFSIQSGAPSPFDISVSSPTLCPGQSDTLMVLGGFSQYLWSNNVSGITNIVNQAGTYTVTVTNTFGCSGTTSVTITPILPPSIEVIAPPLCPGDTAVLSIAGGSFPQYLWSSGQTSSSIQIVQPGIYSVTVSGPGVCSTATSDTVALADLPTAAIDPPDTLNCLISQTQLSASGSSSGPGYSFHWTSPDGHLVSGDSTINPVADAPGTYILSIRNDSTGCVARDTVHLAQDLNPPPADAGNPATLTCTNTSLSIGPNPSPPDPNLLPAWSTQNGQILSGENTWSPQINEPGDYLVIVTNAQTGCTNTALVTIGEDVSAPDAQIAPAALITCQQSTATLDGSGSTSGTSILYLWITSDGLINGPTDLPVSSAGSVGNYQLIVTNTVNGCTDVASVMVSADVNIPVVSALPPDTLTCNLFSTQINAGASSSGPGYQYQWTSPNGNILSGQNTLTPTVDQPGTYFLSLVNTLNNCTATLAVNVWENTQPPVADAGVSQTLSCSTPFTTLDGSSSSSGPNFSYQWSTANGNILSGAQTLNPVINQSGDYQLLVTDQENGCTALSTVQIQQDASVPLAVIQTPPVLNCQVFSASLNAGGSSSGPAFVYTWSTTNGNIVAGSNTLNPSVDAPGVYQLVVTNTANSCTQLASVVVTQDITSPAVDAGNSTLLTCTITSLDLQATLLSSSSQNIDYHWTTSAGQIISGANTSTPLVGAPGTYVVAATDLGNGCTGSDQVIITQDITPPVVALGPPATLTCALNSTTLDATSSSFGNNFQYQWTSSPGGNFVNLQNLQLPVVDAPGVYTLTVTNLSNGCSESAALTVVQDIQPPVAQTNATGGLDCDTPQITLDGGGSSQGPQYLYQWSSLDGQIVSGAGSLSPVVNAPGSYVLTVSNTQNGCTTTDEVIVTEDLQAPLILIAPPPVLTCVLTSTQLIASGNNMGNAPQVSWTTQGGNILAGAGTLQPTVDAPGVYSLLVVNPDNGCQSTISVTLQEDVSAPAAQIQAAPLLTCTVDQVTLQATATAQASIQWLTSDGHFIAGTNGLQPVVDRPGTYLLTVTNPINGCTGSAQVLVAQETNIPTGLDYDMAPPLCNGTPGQVEVSQVIGGVGPFQYSIDGGQTYYSSEIIGGLQPGTYELSIQDANGCELSETIQVPDPPVPAVSLLPELQLALGESLELQALVPSSFPIALIDSVVWTPMSGLTFEGNSIYQLLNPAGAPLQSTQYTVTIYAKEGCTASARTLVRVDRQVDIYAPNVIWPDDPDGNNHRFTLFARDESIAIIRTLQVFDRWGSMVFSNKDMRPNDPEAGWDGSSKGEPANPAVFVWWAKVELIDGREVLISGDVTVVR